MTQRQEKLLTEKLIRPMVRKMLKEAYSSPISKGAIVNMGKSILKDWNALNKILGDARRSGKSETAYDIQNEFYKGDGTIYNQVDENKIIKLLQKLEEELTNQ